MKAETSMCGSEGVEGDVEGWRRKKPGTRQERTWDAGLVEQDGKWGLGGVGEEAAAARGFNMERG
jgi:hypothetical protein